MLFIGPACRELLAPLLDAAGDGPLFTPRAQRRNQRYNATYRTSAYYRAITRAIDRVNEYRVEQGIPLVPHWTPHQVRHSKGTVIREQFGVEAAQSILGHATIQATQIYAQRRLELARRVAEETG